MHRFDVHFRDADDDDKKATLVLALHASDAAARASWLDALGAVRASGTTAIAAAGAADESEGALEGYRSFFWKVRAHVRDHVRPLLCVCGTRLYRRRCFACVRVAFAPRREQTLACADTPSRPRQLSLTTSWRTSCS